MQAWPNREKYWTAFTRNAYTIPLLSGSCRILHNSIIGCPHVMTTKTVKFHIHHSHAMTGTTQFATFNCNWKKTWNTHLHWETRDLTTEDPQLLNKDTQLSAIQAHIEFQVQVAPWADTDSFYYIKLIFIWSNNMNDSGYWGKISFNLFITVKIYPFINVLVYQEDHKINVLDPCNSTQDTNKLFNPYPLT